MSILFILFIQAQDQVQITCPENEKFPCMRGSEIIPKKSREEILRVLGDGEIACCFEEKAVQEFLEAINTTLSSNYKGKEIPARILTPLNKILQYNTWEHYDEHLQNIVRLYYNAKNGNYDMKALKVSHETVYDNSVTPEKSRVFNSFSKFIEDKYLEEPTMLTGLQDVALSPVPKGVNPRGTANPTQPTQGAAVQAPEPSQGVAPKAPIARPQTGTVQPPVSTAPAPAPAPTVSAPPPPVVQNQPAGGGNTPPPRVVRAPVVTEPETPVYHDTNEFEQPGPSEPAYISHTMMDGSVINCPENEKYPCASGPCCFEEVNVLRFIEAVNTTMASRYEGDTLPENILKPLDEILKYKTYESYNENFKALIQLFASAKRVDSGIKQARQKYESIYTTHDERVKTTFVEYLKGDRAPAIVIEEGVKESAGENWMAKPQELSPTGMFPMNGDKTPTRVREANKPRGNNDPPVGTVIDNSVRR